MSSGRAEHEGGVFPSKMGGAPCFRRALPSMVEVMPSIVGGGVEHGKGSIPCRGDHVTPTPLKETLGFDRVLFIFDNWEVTGVNFANHWADGRPITVTVQPYVIEQMRTNLVLVTACDTLAASRRPLPAPNLSLAPPSTGRS